MYGGKEQLVKLKIRDTLVGVMIDRFGKDVMIIPEDKGHLSFRSAYMSADSF